MIFVDYAGEGPGVLMRKTTEDGRSVVIGAPSEDTGNSTPESEAIGRPGASLAGDAVNLEIYRYLLMSAARNRQAQVEYGKWLITSLMVIHAGSLFVIGSSDLAKTILSTWVMWAFASGLLLSLFAGFAAWQNWGQHYLGETEMALTMLQNGMQRVDKHPYEAEIGRSFRLALITGWLSIAALVIGAFGVFSVLSK